MTMEHDPGTATLRRLSDSSLTVANPDDDIRRRKVADRNGDECGEIDDLKIDDREQRVGFMRVGTGGFLGIGETKLTIPIDAMPTALVNEDPTPDAGEAVQATGEIWRFDLPAIEERLGVNLDDLLFADWVDKPVMIATNVTPSSAN